MSGSLESSNTRGLDLDRPRHGIEIVNDTPEPVYKSRRILTEKKNKYFAPVIITDRVF